MLALNQTKDTGMTYTTVNPGAATHRVASIDLLRGLVMIIMALDHVRDFFHAEAFTSDPLNFSTTTPALFFTRWITHFCAPIFVFLAGTSAYLQGIRKNKKQLSLFLIKRGLWLLLVEVFVISLALTFDVSYSSFFLQTIWSIGISMILLGFAIWMPFTAILAVGLLIVLGHNLLDYYEANHKGDFPLLYSLVHRPGFYPLGKSHFLMVLYPFLSWTGLMFLGYCFGKLVHNYTEEKRRRTLTWMGIAIMLFFVALRSSNLYGDAQIWSTQKNFLFTIFSFINTVKYPPSLLFMCMTIGPALLFLAWVGKSRTAISKIIAVYGRVPFLYYILHFYLIHFLVMILFIIKGHSFAEGLKSNQNFPFKFVIPGEGFSLLVVYLIWIAIVAALYPVCKWFSDYKMKHKEKWWLSYL